METPKDLINPQKFVCNLSEGAGKTTSEFFFQLTFPNRQHKLYLAWANAEHHPVQGMKCQGANTAETVNGVTSRMKALMTMRWPPHPVSAAQQQQWQSTFPSKDGFEGELEQSSDVNSTVLISCHFKISFTTEISWDSLSFPHAHMHYSLPNTLDQLFDGKPLPQTKISGDFGCILVVPVQFCVQHRLQTTKTVQGW